MHEASIAFGLLELIERTARANGARSVTRAVVEVGDLSSIHAESLQFAFQAARRGTLAEACELVIERKPLRVRCPGCDYQGVADVTALSCPECGEAPVEVVGGRELRLVTIDVEGDDDGSEPDDEKSHA